MAAWAARRCSWEWKHHKHFGKQVTVLCKLSCSPAHCHGRPPLGIYPGEKQKSPRLACARLLHFTGDDGHSQTSPAPLTGEWAECGGPTTRQPPSQTVTQCVQDPSSRHREGTHRMRDVPLRLRPGKAGWGGGRDRREPWLGMGGLSVLSVGTLWRPQVRLARFTSISAAQCSSPAGSTVERPRA